MLLFRSGADAKSAPGRLQKEHEEKTYKEKK